MRLPCVWEARRVLTTSPRCEYREARTGVHPWFPSQLSNIVNGLYRNEPPPTEDLLLMCWQLLQLAWIKVTWFDRTFSKVKFVSVLVLIQVFNLAICAVSAFKTEVSKNSDPVFRKNERINTWPELHCNTMNSSGNRPRTQCWTKHVSILHWRRNSRRVQTGRVHEGPQFLQTSVWNCQCVLLV